MNDRETYNIVVTRGKGWRVAGMVLFAALMASWFVWGPFGIIFYVGGLFNAIPVFPVSFLLFLLIPLAAIFLLTLALRIAFSWRRLSGRDRVLSSVLAVVLAGFLSSFGLGFAGVTPSAFDMYLRGFARYAAARANVPAIQSWLATLDPNEYRDVHGNTTEKRFAESEQPPCVARLHSKGAKVQRDDKGRLILRTIWGGGLIGHWGIEVGDKSMGLPADSEVIGYQPLAPGAWIWYEL